MPLTPYFKLATYILALIVGLVTGWQVQGWRKDSQIADIHTQEQQAQDKARASVRQIESLQAQAANTAALLEVERQRQARVIERVVTNDVIKYVQRASSQHCGVDSDGVRLINTSAANRMPATTDTASAPDDRAATATAASVVASVTDNYMTCHANADQLRALQDWVRATNAKPGT